MKWQNKIMYLSIHIDSTIEIMVKIRKQDPSFNFISHSTDEHVEPLK